MQYLYTQRSFSAELLRSKPAQRLIEQTTRKLNGAIAQGIGKAPISSLMRESLEQSNRVFSGFKVFHQMHEAFPKMVDSSGLKKPFEQFSNEVLSIHETYNKHYLRSEYNFAVGSSQMAARWERFAAQGDRYLLQYRTAKDEHVRESHRKLHNVTLPVESRFWDEYFPPNGWGCRCTVVQVLKGKYPTSDEQRAMQDAGQSTAGKHAEMFRFNPGKQRACYPAYNPYTISACTDCTKSGFKLSAKIPDNEMCRACAIVREMQRDWQDKKRMTLNQSDKKIKEQLSLYPHKRSIQAKNLQSGEFRLNAESIRAYLYHAKSPEAKWLLTVIMDDLEELKLQKISKLGEGKDLSNPKDQRNVMKKKKKGVKCYCVYDYTYQGKTWAVGCQYIRRGGECWEEPYYVALKSEELSPQQVTG